MSEKQPKLKFEEEKERTATRSPPKKSKVEQSVPKKQKLKQDADKAAEKSQHLRFGKAEISGLPLVHGIAVCCVGDERTVLSAKPYHKTISER